MEYPVPVVMENVNTGTDFNQTFLSQFTIKHKTLCQSINMANLTVPIVNKKLSILKTYDHRKYFFFPSFFYGHERL